MPIDNPQFSEKDVIVNSDKIVYDGFFKMRELRLKHRLFDGGWSQEITREIFHRGDAAAAILYDPKMDSVGMIEQFRVGALASENGPWCIETVAGMMEPGETPDDVILRELEEEAGIFDAELIPISTYFSTPGGCSEKVHLYCAICDLSTAGGIHGLDDENEDICLNVYPANEVFAVMLNNRTNNAATLLALQWLQINKNQLQK